MLAFLLFYSAGVTAVALAFFFFLYCGGNPSLKCESGNSWWNVASRETTTMPDDLDALLEQLDRLHESGTLKAATHIADAYPRLRDEIRRLREENSRLEEDNHRRLLQNVELLHLDMQRRLAEDGGVWPEYTGDGE